MKSRLLILLIFLTILAACTGTPTPTSTPTIVPTLAPTRTLPTASVETTSVPDAKLVAQSYLDAWKAEDYPKMYGLLTAVSRDAIKEEDFTKRYRDVAAEAALSGWDSEILAALVTPSAAQMSYRVILHSVLVGDIQRDTVMNLTLENAQWRIQWDEALILPELKGGNVLRMEYRTPSRGNIYDRDGRATVAQADAVALGLAAGEVDPAEDNGLLGLIYQVTGRQPDDLRPQLENYRKNNWYMPIADISADQIAPFEGRLANYAGVRMTSFRARYYFDEGIAPHITGYVRAIQADEVEKFKRLGYNPWTDRVGGAGLEAWGEPYLAGKRGGALYLYGPDDKPVTILAESNAQPSQEIYTTINKDLQEQAQAALKGFHGAIVVLERNTGRVLAMASSPGYNPNLFEPSNANSGALIGEIYNPDTTPLLNRATEGQYPLGSVFKIVTMSAALKSGLFTAESEYQCGYDFTELSGVTLHDWTWEHYQKDGVTQPSGLLTLPQGLMKSCDPWFWHIGLSLYNHNMVTAIHDMAVGFGLDGRTGFELNEQPGNIPIPYGPLDAANLAIGQGDTLVTPLQVADFVAAVGNGGTLYEPKVVEKIAPPDGAPTYVFTSTVRGTLPITGTQLQLLQEAMVSVMGSNGTARSTGAYLNSLNIPVAGKTGTAQTPFTNPHAWFAGYTFANRPDKPDIAVVVLLELQGEGSEWAAPIFAGMVKLYFYGPPRKTFPWESSPGVWRTPTPKETVTPTPEATETPTPAP